MNYNQFLYDEFPKYLDQVTDESSPKWGIMTGQHLVEHFSLLFALSNGKLQAPDFFPPEKQARRLVGFFEKKMPFVKNFAPLGENKLSALRFGNIGEAKEKLVLAFEQFKRHFDAHPEAECNHPVFGMLDYNQWVEFHARHIVYHLTQFGLMEDAGKYDKT